MADAYVHFFADGVAKGFAIHFHKAARPDRPAQPAFCNSYRRLVKHDPYVACKPALSRVQEPVAVYQQKVIVAL